MSDLTIPIIRDTGAPSVPAVRDGRTAAIAGIPTRAIASVTRVTALTMLTAGNLLDERLVSASAAFASSSAL